MLPTSLNLMAVIPYQCAINVIAMSIPQIGYLRKVN